MYNSNQLNTAKLNETDPMPSLPQGTHSGYPKSGQRIIVWRPTGNIDQNSATTTYPS